MHVNQARSRKNFISAALGQMITIAIGLILPRLYITGYGSDINGLLSSVGQFLVYLSLFEAGVGAAALQALYRPVAVGDTGAICGIVAATERHYRKTGVLYFWALAAFSLVYPFLADSALNYWSVAAVVFLSGIGNVVVFFLQGKYRILLQAEGKNYILTNLSTIVSVVTALAKVILIRRGVAIVWILAASFLISLIQAVYILAYIRRGYPWLVAAEPDEGAVSQRNYVLLHQIADLIFRNTDVLILTVACGLKVVSVYSVYKLIITHLESVLQILSNSCSFALGQCYQVDRRAYIRQIDVFESVYSVAAFSLFSVALHLLLPFMELYTAGVTDAAYCDPRLAALFVAIALLTAMRQPMLLTIHYAGHFRRTTPQTILESVINLAVSLAGVRLWGIYGVLLGTVAALVYRTIDVIRYSNRKLLGRTERKTWGIHLLNLTAAAALYPVLELLDGAVDSYGTFALAGAAELAVTVLVLAAVQWAAFKDVRRMAAGIFGSIQKGNPENCEI